MDILDGVYTSEEIERTETYVREKLIPCKKRVYVNKDGVTVIEYYDDE